MEKSFVFGVATPESNFIGRETDTQRLIRNFEGGVNTILISPRRWGKTSLVEHVRRKLKNRDLVTVYLDIYPCKSEYEFYNALAEAVLLQTAKKPQLWAENARDFLSRLNPKITLRADPGSELTLSLGITPKSHTGEEVLNLAETIAKKRNKRLIVCIDEFQQVGEFPDSLQIQKRMRSVWQHQEFVSYCLFGSKQHMMSRIFQRRNMPFYQFGDTIFLTRISTADWVRYIRRQFSASGKMISEAAAEQICAVTDNYSSYVQQLSWLVLTLMGDEPAVTEELLASGVERLLESNDLLFMNMIAPLTEYQMNFLRAVISGCSRGFGEAKIREEYRLGSPSNIKRLKDTLQDRELIEIEGNTVTISDPVFALWFKRRGLL